MMGLAHFQPPSSASGVLKKKKKAKIREAQARSPLGYVTRISAQLVVVVVPGWFDRRIVRTTFQPINCPVEVRVLWDYGNQKPTARRCLDGPESYSSSQDSQLVWREAVGCPMPRRNQQQISMDVVIHHNDHDHETPVAVANLEDSLEDVETNGYNTKVQVHIEVATQTKSSAR
jgi:hypothetical protein